MDASNLLKPALSRGELHCIGATTLDEYRKYVEKDPALQRRFQPIFVGETTVEDTIPILRGLKEKYELHHGVRITDGALVSAATLRKIGRASRRARACQYVSISAVAVSLKTNRCLSQDDIYESDVSIKHTKYLLPSNQTNLK